MEKLCDLIQRRTAIEAKMLATSKKIEDAFMLADQALEFAIARRLQTIEEHKRVKLTYPLPNRIMANAISRHR